MIMYYYLYGDTFFWYGDQGMEEIAMPASETSNAHARTIHFEFCILVFHFGLFYIPFEFTCSFLALLDFKN